MKKNRFTKSLAAICLSGAFAIGNASEKARASKDRPNVLMIVCDDLNDYTSALNGHPQARTPNIDRLAKSGVSFTRAYSNFPLCATSRASFFSGIYTHTAQHNWKQRWYNNEVMNNSRTLPNHFKQNGYFVIGSGKLMHDQRNEEWTEYKHKIDYGPFWYKNGKRLAHPGVPQPYASIGCVDGSYGSLEEIPAPDKRAKGEGWIYGTWGKPEYMRVNGPDDRDPTPDERNAAWAAKTISDFAKKKMDKPFFLGVGFVRPHTPLIVPKKYFDQFPLDKVKLPVLKKNDGQDTHLNDFLRGPGFKYFRLLQESYKGNLEGLKSFVQAYLACVAAVDDNIGQVLDALDKSPFRDNTIVVLTSDHGWSMGEKDWLYKLSLWEDTCRIPMIIRVPGMTPKGGQSGHPVSLIDLYPTMVDLCGLKGDTRKNEKGAPLDGHSMRPFLADPKNGTWDGPDAALSMILPKFPGKSYPMSMMHYSIRTRDYRYTLYNNGKEEVYDHRSDPNEWTNLAGDPKLDDTRAKFRQRLEKRLGFKVGEDK